jgi:hypothetical protein
MTQHALERPSTLMIAQRMSNVAARLLHIQRHAPVALLVGRDFIQSKELPVNAIRNGQMVDVLLSTDEGMIHHFHLPIILEGLDKGDEEEVFERLQDLANEHLQWAHYGAYGAGDSHWVFIKQETEA